MSFPKTDFVRIHTTTEAHMISQLEQLMIDNGLEFRVRGSRNASSMDQAPILTRIHLEVASRHVDDAKQLVDAFFAPIDPNDPNLPEELRPE